MEKIPTSLRVCGDEQHNHKNRFCVTCGNVATKETLFKVGRGITLIERYLLYVRTNKVIDQYARCNTTKT
jgi:hypothetical protein